VISENKSALFYSSNQWRSYHSFFSIMSQMGLLDVWSTGEDWGCLSSDSSIEINISIVKSLDDAFLTFMQFD
jgi:hypothetical protein